MAIHEIRISDPMFFKGPDGDNRIWVRGLGVIHGSPHYMVPDKSYLVEVMHPFTVDGQVVGQLVVNERLSNTTLEEVISGDGAVGIARFKPGRLLAAGSEYEPFDMDYWAIAPG
jgi:hypothetical protein